MFNYCVKLHSTIFIAALAFLTANGVQAESGPDKNQDRWYSLTFENDAFGVKDTSDDGYSNGISIAWGKGARDRFSDVDMPDWIRAISSWTYLNSGGGKQYSINYSFAQGMYTPGDLEESALIVDDQPYVGTLLWASRIHSYDEQIANSLALTLGIVGPLSLAEQSQTVIHEIIGAREPQGWDNQLHNEPVFRMSAENIIRLYDLSFNKSVEFDANLYSQLGVGNLLSDVGTGLVLRIGNQLDQSYAYINPIPARGVNTLAGSPSDGLNWQIVASAFGRYVFNDITINGNTFKDSHSVDLVNEQGVVSLAFAVSWEKWGFIFSSQRGGDIFEGQTSPTNFGAVSLTYHQ